MHIRARDILLFHSTYNLYFIFTRRCSYYPYHSGNPKALRSCQKPGTKTVCIPYSITISFPCDEHYCLLLQGLNHLNKSRPIGLSFLLCLQCPTSSGLISHCCLHRWHEIQRHQTVLSSPKLGLPFQAFRNLLLSSMSFAHQPSPWWACCFPLTLH